MLGRGLIINLIWILHEVSCRHHPNPIKRIEPGLRINKIIDRNHVNIDFTLPGAGGFSDTMVLKRFFQKNEANGSDSSGCWKCNFMLGKSCNYVGHLLSDKNSAVSVAGCLFREDVTTTITSSKYPIQSHLWKLYGTVEELNMDNVMNPPNFKPRVDKSYPEESIDEYETTTEGLDQNQDELIIDSELDFETSTDSQSDFESSTDEVQDEYETSTDDETTIGTQDIPIPQESIDLEYCALRLKGNIKGLIPPELTFKITANYEDSFLESFNYDKANAEASIMEAITQAQPMFLDPTLGTRVHLKLVGEFTYFPGERLTAEQEDGLERSAQLLKQANSSLLFEATHVMFTNDSCPVREECTVRGVAWGKSVCSGSYAKRYGYKGLPSVAIVERADQYGWLLAHELGHVLGMDHNWEWEEPRQPRRGERKPPLLPKGYCNDGIDPVTGQQKVEGKISNLMRNLVFSKRRTWSICNRCDVLKYYQDEMIRNGEFCLTSDIKPKGSFSTLKKINSY